MAPRPHLVVPKKPLLRRRGVQVTLALILLAAVGLVVLLAISSQRRADRLAGEREDTSSFGTFVEEILRTNAIGEPFLASYLILPELRTTIGQLGRREVQAGRIAEQAEAWSGQLTDAAATIGQLQPELESLREARNLMRQSLEMYAGIADSVAVVAGLDREERRTMATVLERQLNAAEQVWSAGYGKLGGERVRLGLLDPTALSPPGLPG